MGQDNPKGSVMVVGGGIAGMQAALDLADSGSYVHLTEGSPAIGGVWANSTRPFPPMTAPCELFPPNRSRSAGVHLMAIEWEHKVPEIAERAGVLPRPTV
jgi:heterodisulfide reductase subunit A